MSLAHRRGPLRGPDSQYGRGDTGKIVLLAISIAKRNWVGQRVERMALNGPVSV